MNAIPKRRQALVRGGRGLVLAALLMAGAACGSDDADTAGGEPAPAETTGMGGDTTSDDSQSFEPSGTIVVENFEFAPGRLAAKVGDTITVRNKDAATHSVTAKSDKALFDTGEFTSGERQITLTKAGTFDFACTVHSYMEGVIQVSA